MTRQRWQSLGKTGLSYHWNANTCMCMCKKWQFQHNYFFTTTFTIFDSTNCLGGNSAHGDKAWQYRLGAQRTIRAVDHCFTTCFIGCWEDKPKLSSSVYYVMTKYIINKKKQLYLVMSTLYTTRKQLSNTTHITIQILRLLVFMCAHLYMWLLVHGTSIWKCA